MEERQWIQRSREGDRDAFGLLVEKHQGRVYHQALRLTGHPEDAWDVTQEVFLKAWQGLPKFQEESALSTWLYRLTSNAAIDLLRREKRRRGGISLDEEDSPIAAALADPSPTPQQRLEEKELQEAVAAGLGRLTREHREVLVLREVNGLSYEEISRVLEVSVGTVKSRLARARAALAKFLP